MSDNNRAAREGTLDGRIKLYYDLDLPEARPAPLLIALHGYGEDKELMMRQAQALIPEGFAIASLQGFHQHMKRPKEPGGPRATASVGSQTFTPKTLGRFIIRRCWI